MTPKKKKMYKSGSATLFSILAKVQSYPKAVHPLLGASREIKKKKGVQSPEGFMLQSRGWLEYGGS